MNRTMKIKISSGLSADGFDVTIQEKDDTLFKKSYHYGYSASYKKDWATEKEPYVTDILKDLQMKYDVAFNDIDVVNGRNVFKGDSVSDDVVQRFMDKYMMELSLPDLTISDQDLKTIEDVNKVTEQL